MKKHFKFINQGTIIQIVCLTEEAKEWLVGNCQIESWQLIGDTLNVEYRMFDSIYEGIKAAFEAEK